MPSDVGDRAEGAAWPLVRLGDVCHIQLGKMLSPKSKIGSNMRPYLRNANVQWGRFDLSDVAEMNFEPREEAKFRLEPGDLLVCEGGEPGRSAVWRGGIEPCFYQKALHRLRPKHGTVDTEFLMYRLWHASSAGEFAGSERKSTIAHLPLERIQEIRLRLPALAEQRRIAAMLRDAFGHAERARAAVLSQVDACLQLGARALVDAFQGVSPVSTVQDPHRSPSGWRWHTLTSVARLESGHTPSRRHPEWWGGDIPWIALPDIRALDGSIAHDTVEHTNELGIANSSARILPQHTVVMCRDASVGYVTIMGRPMATSQHFVNWVCGPELDPFFLAYALRASREYIRRLASGSVLPTIYMPTLHSLNVCMPPIEEQRRIVAELDMRLAEAERLRTALAGRLSAIEALPATIMCATFNPRAVAVADEPTVVVRAERHARSAGGVYFRRGAVASYLVERLHAQPTFGRVTFQKLLYLAEAHVGVELEGEYQRKAAGPLAVAGLPKLESLAAKQGWFTREPRDGGRGYRYAPGPRIGDRVAAAVTLLGDQRGELDRLVDLLGSRRTEEVEVVATLFAAWNDFLLDGRAPTDMEIVREVRTHWHPSKTRFTEEQLMRALAWMKKRQLVPVGRGPRTELVDA